MVIILSFPPEAEHGGDGTVVIKGELPGRNATEENAAMWRARPPPDVQLWARQLLACVGCDPIGW
jgi:hypothetical protein